MRALALALASSIVLALLGCGEPMPTADAGRVDTGPVTCDPSSRPDLGSSAQLVRGLVVARDGTMYFGSIGGVGRRRPDGTLDTMWVPIAGSGTIGALTLDATNEALFVASPDPGHPTAASIVRVDVAAETSTPVLIGGFPLGLTMGGDGMLYYAEVALDAVMRIAPSGGTATTVTTSTIMSPQGLAFEASGTLLVTSGGLGQIFRVTLGPSGTETGRVLLAPFSSPEGIGLDALGRIYVASGFGHSIVRMDADGTSPTVLTSALGGGPWFFDFGRGALCPTDIFVAQGSIVRVPGDTPGADVPWH